LKEADFKKNLTVRVIVVVSLMLFIAAIHAFRIGQYLNGDLYIYYYSFASDIMLPFGAYFMLSMNEIQIRFLRKWIVKFLIVFCVMTFSEIMQYFGIYFFGVTFDILDILMFGIGGLLAAFFDKQIFERLIPYWNYNPEINLTLSNTK